MSARHSTANLDEVEDIAAKHGMGEMGETRVLRDALGARRIGLSNYRMNPGRRVGFGHRHEQSEEMYVVLTGSGRFRIDDEILDVGPRDVVFCPPDVMREWEAGPDGMELLAFGGHAEDESEMKMGWWTD